MQKHTKRKPTKNQSKRKDLDWPMLGMFFYQLLFFVFMQVLLKRIDQGWSSIISSEEKVSECIQRVLFDWLLPYYVAEVYFQCIVTKPKTVLKFQIRRRRKKKRAYRTQGEFHTKIAAKIWSIPGFRQDPGASMSGMVLFSGTV